MIDHPRRREMAAHFKRRTQRVEGKQAAQGIHEYSRWRFETNKQIIDNFEHSIAQYRHLYWLHAKWHSFNAIERK
jgi:hypothetical protein